MAVALLLDLPADGEAFKRKLLENIHELLPDVKISGVYERFEQLSERGKVIALLRLNRDADIEQFPRQGLLDMLLQRERQNFNSTMIVFAVQVRPAEELPELQGVEYIHSLPYALLPFDVHWHLRHFQGHFEAATRHTAAEMLDFIRLVPRRRPVQPPPVPPLPVVEDSSSDEPYSSEDVSEESSSEEESKSEERERLAKLEKKLKATEDDIYFVELAEKRMRDAWNTWLRWLPPKVEPSERADALYDRIAAELTAANAQWEVRKEQLEEKITDLEEDING